MRPHPAISLAVSASLSMGGAAPALAADHAGPAAGLSIKVGQADGFSRIEFDGRQPKAARREGQELVLQFGAVETPNLSLLKVDPPRFLATASAQQTPQGLELRLTLPQGVQAKVGRADGGVYVNLTPGADTPPPRDQPPDRKSSPIPASGVVKAQASLEHGALSLRFAWRAPVGAAAFRRGDAVWLVFDAKAGVDLHELPDGLLQARHVQVVSTPDATVLRIATGPGVTPTMAADGPAWILTLSAAGATPPTPVAMKSDADGLSAQIAGATGVFWFDDPVVGDRLAAVTALGPPKGLLAERRLVDADLYPSAQGLGLAALAQDLSVTSDGDVVRLARPSGMQLSAGVSAAPLVRPPAALPQPAAMPALIDFEGWSRTDERGFLPRYDALLQGASSEGALGNRASLQARFGFARFLVGSQLAFEAIGILDLMAKTRPEVLSTPEFRGLRGAARVLAGRYKDALADFSSPAVSDDPASALWRGYAALKLGDNTGARQAFAAGTAALTHFSRAWRERFVAAAAEAALATGDLAGARNLLQQASDLKPEGVDADRMQLDLGRLAQATGQSVEALPFYAKAQTSDYGGVAVPALLYATEVQESAGRMTPDAAADVLASVPFRWRGDATELEAARALGRLYIGEGRYRQALAALRAVQNVSPGLAASAAVANDLSATFRGLFVDGGADGLPPIQALSLFLDFKDLTPIGADGDAMVRKLARRLVDVDLLDQAAVLLKYQVDNRLDGVAKASVATDLALIEVMNHQPEAALDAINGSRTTLLPSDLQSRRRVIQARALAALGRYDDALEILADDRSADAESARAEIAWRKRDWPEAGKLMELALGPRYRSPTPLNDLEQTELLRAAIAYSLAGDDAGLARLRSRYGKATETSKTPDMLKVALAGVSSGYGAADYAKAASDADGFASWVQAMKARLLTSGLKTA